MGQRAARRRNIADQFFRKIVFCSWNFRWEKLRCLRAPRIVDKNIWAVISYCCIASSRKKKYNFFFYFPKDLLLFLYNLLLPGENSLGSSCGGRKFVEIICSILKDFSGAG